MGQSHAYRNARVVAVVATSAVLASAWLAGTCPARAADLETEVATLRAELDEARLAIRDLSAEVRELRPGAAGARPRDSAAPTRTDGPGSVISFDAERLRIGGFVTQTFTSVAGDDSSEQSFDQTLLEILVSAEVSERTTFFTAFGFLRAADIDLSDADRPAFAPYANRTPQIIAWANHRFSDRLEARAGRWVTPHGVINIEHFPPVLLELNQPQFLRPFGGATLFPNFMNGLQLHGRMLLGTYGESELEYSAYTGTFAQDPDSLLHGGRVAWRRSDDGVTVGVNYSRGRRDAGSGGVGFPLSTTPAASTLTNDYDLFGLDLLIERDRLLWKTELFVSAEEGEQDRGAFYTQPAWRFSERWLGFYRIDFLDPGQSLRESLEHVLGVNFMPTSTMRLRAAYIRKEYRSSSDSNDVFQLSGTLSF